MKRLLPLIAVLATLMTFCAPALTPTPTLAPTPTRATTPIPSVTATLTVSPTPVSTSTPTRTETLAGTPSPTIIARLPEPSQTATATRVADNSPVSCEIPGTRKIGIGFFDLQSRTVTFCLPDLASMDACEPRTLEYCHCNNTSGCCQKPADGDLIIGERTVTLRYPAGTTSFQASIPPACRSHNSDRVLIMGFAGPLP